MESDFDDKRYRDAFVAANLRTGIAFQIRALREQRGWSQQILGVRTGKGQGVISRLEDPDYGRLTLRTLLDIASAFDVALLVKFVSFERLEQELTDLSPSALAVPSYEPKRQLRRPEVGNMSASVLDLLRHANQWQVATGIDRFRSEKESNYSATELSQKKVTQPRNAVPGDVAFSHRP